jgi:hypothetical protein
LFGGDVTDGGVEPPTIVIAFDAFIIQRQ